jgi:hypothetical protein
MPLFRKTRFSQKPGRFRPTGRPLAVQQEEIFSALFCAESEKILTRWRRNHACTNAKPPSAKVGDEKGTVFFRFQMKQSTGKRHAKQQVKQDTKHDQKQNQKHEAHSGAFGHIWARSAELLDDNPVEPSFASPVPCMSLCLALWCGIGGWVARRRGAQHACVGLHARRLHTTLDSRSRLTNCGRVSQNCLGRSQAVLGLQPDTTPNLQPSGLTRIAQPPPELFDAGTYAATDPRASTCDSFSTRLIASRYLPHACQANSRRNTLRPSTNAWICDASWAAEICTRRRA